MGKLDSVLAARTGKSVDPVQSATLALLSKLNDDRSISNAQLASAISKGLDALYSEVVKVIRSTDSTGKAAAIEKTLLSTAKSVENLAKQLKSLETLSGIESLRSDVASVSEKVSDDSMKRSVDALRSAIQGVKIPTPDLTPVLAVSKAQESLNGALANLNTRLDSQMSEEWTFEVEREDFTDKIKNVTARRVA